MIEHDKFQYDFFFNGEPASEKQLLGIDQKVDELMLGISPVMVQGYTIEDQDKECELYLELVRHNNSGEVLIAPSVVLSVEDEEEIAIEFDSERGAELDLEDDPDWVCIDDVCTSLLHSGDLDETNYGIVERIRDASRAAQRHMDPKEVLEMYESSYGSLDLGEAITRSVLSNFSFTTVSRRLKRKLASPIFLEIDTYGIDGRILHDELVEMPKINLKIHDELANKTYIYVKHQNDVRQQDIGNDAEERADYDITYQNEVDRKYDSVVKRFNQQIGLYEVCANYAVVIDKVLTQALSLEAVDITFNE